VPPPHSHDRTALLLRDAELDGATRADVRIAQGRVVEIGPALPRQTGEEEIRCDGGAVLPGLADHHLHLHALAARQASIVCGPPEVTSASGLAAALAAAVPDEHGWVRGVGYIETVAGDLDAEALDRLGPRGPVRVQHRSGAMWMLNSAAMAATGLSTADHPGVERGDDGRPTGRLWRADDWLRDRLPPARPPDLSQAGAELAGLGVTSVTDATPDLAPGAIAAIAEAARNGALLQRVRLLGVPLDTMPPEPLGVGPYKIVIADSGLPDLDELTERIRRAHAVGRPVAAHCVTREALIVFLAALEDAGPLDGDRVEHAALVPAELVPELARRRLRVVTQPGFLTDRGDDFLRGLPAADHADLYRCASLATAGVPVALSSDAPYGPIDPWAVIAAAAERRVPGGRVAGPEERISPRRALDAYLAPTADPGGPPRRVRPGVAADLTVLHLPLAEALRAPCSRLVRTVFIDGEPVA